MSLTLPIEDLSRLKISATLSKTGQPMLSLMLNSSVNTMSNPNYSGVYVSFQGVIVNGCWTLGMEALFEDFSPRPENSSALVPGGPPVINILATESAEASDWTSGMMPAPLSAEPIPSNSSLDIPNPNQSGMEMGLTSDDYLGWLPEYEPMDIGSTNVGQDPSQNVSEQSVPQFPSEVFDGFFPPSLPGSTMGATQPGSTATTSIPSSSPRYDDEDDSDSTHSSQSQSSRQARRRHLPCLDPSCKKKFVSEHTRQTHMKSHQPKARQTLPCTMGCNRQFSRQHDRFRHEVTQHGYQSEWTCDQCHGFFSSEKSRNSHKCTGSGRWRIIPHQSSCQ